MNSLSYIFKNPRQPAVLLFTLLSSLKKVILKVRKHDPHLSLKTIRTIKTMRTLSSAKSLPVFISPFLQNVLT